MGLSHLLRLKKVEVKVKSKKYKKYILISVCFNMCVYLMCSVYNVVCVLVCIYVYACMCICMHVCVFVAECVSMLAKKSLQFRVVCQFYMCKMWTPSPSAGALSDLAYFYVQMAGRASKLCT